MNKKTEALAGALPGQQYNSKPVLNIPRHTIKRKQKVPFSESHLVRYKKSLLDLPYSITVSRIVDCIDFILEHRAEVPRG